MTLLTGNDGSLYLGNQRIAPVSDWTLARNAPAKAYVANDTGGWHARVGGAKDGSGTFRLQVTKGVACPVAEADAVTLRLYADRSGANRYDVPAVIDRIDIAMDISGDTLVVLAVRFSANGPIVARGILTKP